MAMACKHVHFLPDFNPVHTKYVAPSPGAIHVAYKTRPSNSSQKLTRFVGSRPRDDVYRPHAYPQTVLSQPSEVVIYQPTPRNYNHRYELEDSECPIHYTHVHGTKRSRSHDDVARLERRFSHVPAVTTTTKHVHSRYLYEHESRLPPPSLHYPSVRTVAVSPGPAPRQNRHSYYAKPTPAGSSGWQPSYVMEIRQRR